MLDVDNVQRKENTCLLKKLNISARSSNNSIVINHQIATCHQGRPLEVKKTIS
jgi:hypothetical protein